MKILRAVAMTLSLVAVFSVFSGCGKTSERKGVSDILVEGEILDYLEERDLEPGDYNSYSFSVKHNVDMSRHYDNAVITLQIFYNYVTETVQLAVVYVYDRTSDLWSLVRKTNWTDAKYTYESKKLCGEWHVDHHKESIDFTIKSVDGTTAELEYFIEAEASTGYLSEPVGFNLTGDGKYEISNCYISIPIDLPEGFKVDDGRNQMETSTRLSLRIDRQRGFPNFDGIGSGAMLYGTIYYMP